MLGLISSRRRGAVLVVAAALVITAATGCDAGHPPAAVVEGREIKDSWIYSFMDVLEGNVPAGATAEADYRGEGTGTWKTETTSQVLAYLIAGDIAIVAAEKRGLTVSDDDRTQGKTAVAQIFAKVGADGNPSDDGTAGFGRLPKDLQTILIESSAAQAALQRDLGKDVDQEAAARKAFDADPSQYQDVCLRTLTVPSPEILALVQNRLKAGEDFATVAKDASIDDFKAQGGDNGCASITSYAEGVRPDILGAKPTDVIGPYNGSDGSSVLAQVYAVKPADFDSVKADIIKTLPAAGEAELTAFLAKAYAAAKVRTDPRFGRWDGKGRQVVPPAAPAAPRTATTAPATP